MDEKTEITKEMSEQEALKIGSACNTCGKCCSYGSGMMLSGEIARIANFLGMSPEKFKADMLTEIEIFHTPVFKIKSVKIDDKAYGPCMFLEDRKCKVHDVKPLHCRVCNCEKGDDLQVWFMVNYLLNIHDPESVRQYDSYIKTGGRMIPGAELEKLFPDKDLLRQILNYERLR
jgi:Fe-S-cluster containining protein